MNSATLLNAGCLVNSFAFVVVVLSSAHRDRARSSFFDDGFCVLKDPAWLNSHLLCFAADAIGATVLAWLGGATAMSHAPGVAIHGVAHLALWAGLLGGDAGPGHTWERGGVSAVALLVLFFAALFRSLPTIPPAHNLAWSTTHALILALHVPQSFAFTYVQLALSSVALSYELVRSRAGRHQWRTALLLHVPASLAVWPELLCTPTYRSLGGHVWYDATLVICTVLVATLEQAAEGSSRAAGKTS